MGGNSYVIDTSSLIRLASFNRSVFVGLWANMEGLIEEGRLSAPKAVLNDLKAKDDRIFRWAKAHDALFVDISSRELEILRDIENSHPNWVDINSAKNHADPYVVALAAYKKKQRQRKLRHYKVTIVTEESKDPKRLKIPSVAKDYGIESIDLDGLFQMEGWKF